MQPQRRLPDANDNHQVFGGREHVTLAARLKLSAATIAVATFAVGGIAQAESINAMDYMTEGTGSVAVDAAIAACTKDTGITVDRQAVPYPELVQKVLLAASSNSLPDIIYIDNSDVAQLADGGYIMPLSDVGLTTEGFVPALAALGNFKGVDYAVPSANNTIALYYNTEMFKAAGLEPPKSWAELRDTAKKLTKDQTYGLVFPGINNEQGTFHTSTFVWSNGGSFDKLNSPETVGALQFLADLVADGSVSKSVVTWAIEDARDQFVSGRAAMMVGGSWLLPQLDEHPDLPYAVAPLPPVNAGEQVHVPVGGELWVVSVTANKPAAKAVLECLSKPDVLLTYAEARNNIPALASLTEKFNADLPRMAPFVAEMPGAVSRTAVLGTAYPKYSAAYSAAMQAALIGQKTPQAALDEAQQTATGQ
jgi:multiple sugar transport system substrate-binding protein